MLSGFWDLLRKKLFPNYRQLEQQDDSTQQQLEKIKADAATEAYKKEREEKFQQAIRNEIEKADVSYHRFLDTKPKTLLIRANRGDKQLILYNLEERPVG